MQASFPDDYKPLLLPETRELAFNTVLDTGRKCLEASHLRHVAPPVVVNATGAPGEISFTFKGVPQRLALPTDLSEWKARKMQEYGIGAGYGLYTYTVLIDSDAAPDQADGPINDRWSCIRSLEPEYDARETLCGACARVHEIAARISAAINAQFPHLASDFPGQVSFAEASGCDCAAEIRRTVRQHGSVAVTSADSLSAEMYLWNDITGREMHVASLRLTPEAVNGWISPSRIAVRVLRLCSVSEIFPIA